MGSMRRRLDKLAGTGIAPEDRRSPQEAYARMREDARRDVEEDLARGEEPLHRIAENGDVYDARDGRLVRNRGDYGRALTRRIRETEREIARLEREIAAHESGLDEEEG